MPTEMMRQRHAAYTTPDPIICGLVNRATGQQGVTAQQIMRGYYNEVYVVTTDRGQDFVVRIRRYGETGFTQEAWALAQCRATGVPVPDVLLVDKIREAAWAGEVMVQQRIQGFPLRDLLPVLATTERARVIAQAGEALGRIHQVQVDGFYRLNSNWQWDFPTWEALMDSYVTDRTADVPLLHACGFKAFETETMLRMIEEYRQNWPCAHPVLCHGVFHADHILISDSHELAGVIDFGEFHGGAPIADVAFLNMKCPAINLDWLADGYGRTGLFDETFAVHLALAKVGLQIGELAWSVRNGIRENIALGVEGLRATLQMWQSGIRKP